MASAGAGGSLPPNFLLTPQQQNLLFAALNSNKQPINTSPSTTRPSAFPSSAPYREPSLNSLDPTMLGDSTFPDNLDFGGLADSSFDFSFNDADLSQLDDKVDTSKSESPDNDALEKRSHPDDDDEEDSPENDPKRRESTEKVAKKPGRKPLTSEPSSKRKAQNRAAQRAFRERKEKHLKDLETKVEELEKQSEEANHENTLLRAQVEKMTTELNQYKQRASLLNSMSHEKLSKGTHGRNSLNSLNEVNFQFEFPKFGMLPGPDLDKQKPQAPSPAKSNSWDEKSTPLSQQAMQNAQFTDDLAKYAGILTPALSNGSGFNVSRASVDSINMGSGAATSSPSSSTQSQVGPSSSCGTSPEPFTQSPTSFKPAETLTTIGEEQPSFTSTQQPFSQFANLDSSATNFDWLAQQNCGGQFDPELFGGYREPQENVLANPLFDDFLNDSFNADFFTPYMAPSPNLPKTNLIEQIDAQQNAVDDEPKPDAKMCERKFWDKLQSCPQAQSGEFDLDGLCSELTKKAKCSGSGPVVGESDFDNILKKFVTKETAGCVAKSLGIEIEPDAKRNGLSAP